MKNFILQQRDIEILRSVNRYRYLQTGQIKRILFSGNTTEQSTRRRLGYLLEANLLGRLALPLSFDQKKPEAVYYLERDGAKFLELQNEDVFFYSKADEIKPIFLNHALDISEFRLNLEIALREHPTVELKTFIADFVLKANFHSFKGRWRYILYNQVLHKLKQKVYSVYPDALIILQGKGKYKDYQKLYFLEIDRGTAGLRIIQEKVIGYTLFLEEGYFEKAFPGFKEFTVLLQTNSEPRAWNIRNKISTESGSDLFWITYSSKVNEHTIVSESIWIDDENKLRCIVKS